jgi:hypothetical protein
MLDYRLYMRTDPSGGFQQPLAGRCQERLDIRRIVLAAYHRLPVPGCLLMGCHQGVLVVNLYLRTGYVDLQRFADILIWNGVVGASYLYPPGLVDFC